MLDNNLIISYSPPKYIKMILFSEPAGTQSMLLSGYTGEDDRGESSSILSELPKLLMGRKKKYSMKKKQGIFGLF